MAGSRRGGKQATDTRELKTTDSKRKAVDESLPIARHASIVGTQALLLGFTALYLPRSTDYIMGEGYLPPPSSSLDRPQYPFLDPITASPVATMLWLCAGVGVVIPWSAGYLRVWFRQGEQTAVKSEAEAREAVKASPKGKVPGPRSRFCPLSTYTLSGDPRVVVCRLGGDSRGYSGSVSLRSTTSNVSISA